MQKNLPSDIWGSALLIRVRGSRAPLQFGSGSFKSRGVRCRPCAPKHERVAREIARTNVGGRVPESTFDRVGRL